MEGAKIIIDFCFPFALGFETSLRMYFDSLFSLLSILLGCVFSSSFLVRKPVRDVLFNVYSILITTSALVYNIYMAKNYFPIYSLIKNLVGSNYEQFTEISKTDNFDVVMYVSLVHFIFKQRHEGRMGSKNERNRERQKKKQKTKTKLTFVLVYQVNYCFCFIRNTV